MFIQNVQEGLAQSGRNRFYRRGQATAMPVVRITFTNRSVDDLNTINKYRSLHSPAYADHLIDSIITQIERLKSFPAVGRKVPEFDLPYLRELVQNDYRIVYKIVSDGQIDITTVQHCSRDISTRFFDAE